VKIKIIIVIILMLMIPISAFAGFVSDLSMKNDDLDIILKGSGTLYSSGIAFTLLSGTTNSSPDDSWVIVDIEHNVNIANIIHIEAIIHNDTLGIGFTQGCNSPHPNGQVYGNFDVFYDDEKVYVTSPFQSLWGEDYYITFFYYN